MRKMMIHIDGFSFGKIVVNGVSYNSDIKIIGEKIVSNWWRQSGHRVSVEDIKDLLASGPDAVVIGQGNPGLMKTTDSVRNLLEENGIILLEEETGRAVQVFNEFVVKGQNVAAGFHVGC